MKYSLKILILALVLLSVTAPVFALEDWETKQIPYDVEAGVVCVLDNCMMNLAACDTPAAQTLRTVIREKMFKEGLNKEQTYAYLAEVYGEKTLNAPPKKGFNWVAWLTPFVAVAGGLAVVYLGLDRWVRPQEASDFDFATTNADEMDSEEQQPLKIEPGMEKRLEEELKKYL